MSDRDRRARGGNGAGRDPDRDESARDRVDELLFKRADGELSRSEADELHGLLNGEPLFARRAEVFVRVAEGVERVAQGAADGRHAAAERILGAAETSAAAPRRAYPRRQAIVFAVAACVVLAAVLGAVWINARPSLEPIDAHWMYATLTTHMQPQVICDTPEKFIEYTLQSLGAPITADFTAGVGLIGWRSVDPGAYEDDSEPIGRRVLLARVQSPGDTPVLLVFDPLGAAPPELTDWPSFLRDRPPAADLNRFKREIAGVHIYELTPLSEPLVLPILSLADE